MLIRTLAIIFLLTVPALAQQQAPSVSERMLQGIIGQLVVQNAKLSEQVQQLNEQNEELKKQIPQKK